jgi:membrane-bound lytic murein transglycosylase D
MDDRTVIESSPPPTLHLRIKQGTGWSQEMVFTLSFRIGRSPECEVHVAERAVSKFHAEVKPESGQWFIKDLQSANGIYLNGARVQHIALPPSGRIELGQGGPILWMAIDQGAAAPETPSQGSAEDEPGSVTEIVRRYSTPSTQEEGERTKLMRDAFERVKKHGSRKYQAIIAIVVVLLIGSGTVAVQQYRKIQELKTTASEIFYSMKQLELQIAQLEEMISTTADAKQMADIIAKRQQIRNLELNYDRFIDQIGIYQAGMSEQDRAVFRVARLFGECEASMPPEFLTEVKKYINKWKTTDRLTTSLRRASDLGYTFAVANSLVARNLPPQFFFLALQESGFNPEAVGPKTRFGYAKGIWQFMSPTAEQYGLRPGPLKLVGRYDPLDERYHFEKATEAAARYLKRLYTTDAQASGLLVMASYNWGEGNVIKIIRQMPENPKERNFWKLLQGHKIPQETYDYVFYIVSAAVIADNPKLFGFEFNNPLPEFARY